jgi:hypothetical protein
MYSPCIGVGVGAGGGTNVGAGMVARVAVGARVGALVDAEVIGVAPGAEELGPPPVLDGDGVAPGPPHAEATTDKVTARESTRH